VHFSSDLHAKAARDRAWLIGDAKWMRRWLLERASSVQKSELEVKSRFGEGCLVLAAHSYQALRFKAVHPSNYDPS